MLVKRVADFTSGILPLLADAMLAEAVRNGWLTPAVGAAGPLPPRQPVMPLAAVLNELAGDRDDARLGTAAEAMRFALYPL